MKRAKPTFADQLLRLIALMLVVFLILGSLAGNVDPRDNRLVPFFGLAYPYFLLLNIFMIACIIDFI